MNVLTATIPSTCGHVTLNGEPLDRRWRRKMAYVMQKDAFYASLTLRETLTVKINVTSIYSTTTTTTTMTTTTTTVLLLEVAADRH